MFGAAYAFTLYSPAASWEGCHLSGNYMIKNGHKNGIHDYKKIQLQFNIQNKHAITVQWRVANQTANE